MPINTITFIFFNLIMLTAGIVYLVWFTRCMNDMRRSVADINYRLDFVMRNMAGGASCGSGDVVGAVDERKEVNNGSDK